MTTPKQLADGLDEGLHSDIFYDARSYGDESAERQIEKFRSAVLESAIVLRQLEAPTLWLAVVTDEDGNRVNSVLLEGDNSTDSLRQRAGEHFGDLPAGHNCRFAPVGPDRADLAFGFAGDIPAQPEIIKVEPESLDETGQVPYLAMHVPAAPDAVAHVLAQPTDGFDGRSDWKWFRLPNGDLILGVFPQGDTYMQHSDSLGF